MARIQKPRSAYKSIEEVAFERDKLTEFLLRGDAEMHNMHDTVHNDVDFYDTQATTDYSIGGIAINERY